MSCKVQERRRRKFDVGTKLVLAREAQATSLNAVSKKYDVARQNLRLWIRTYAQLERHAQEQELHQQRSSRTSRRSHLYRLPGAGRRVSCTQLDQALVRRVAEHRADGAIVTRRLLQDWALELKAALHSDVAIGPSWISRFMQRHRMSATTRGTIVPTDANAPDQQRRTRVVVPNEEKLAIVVFFETSHRDIDKTLQHFYGPITDPKMRQVKMRNIYHWLHKRDEIAQRVQDAQRQCDAEIAAVAPDQALRSSTVNGVGADTETRPYAARSFSRLLASTGHSDEEEEGEADDANDERASHDQSDHMLFARQRDDTEHEFEVVRHAFHDHAIDAPPQSSSASEREVSADVDSHLEPEDAERELERRRQAVFARQAALNAQKEQLLAESIRCSNALKRIKAAEENIFARKRLRDAGVAQQDVDELLPLVRFAPDEG